MAGNRRLFTVGLWTTKPGMEQEFIEAWQSFADWTTGNMRGAGAGTLLQHDDAPQRFVSFGPWDDPEAIVAWRDQPRFKEFVATVRELCEEFEPQNMTEVGYSSPA